MTDLCWKVYVFMLKLYFPVERMNEVLIPELDWWWAHSKSHLQTHLQKLLTTRSGGLQNSHIDINIEFIDT